MTGPVSNDPHDPSPMTGHLFLPVLVTLPYYHAYIRMMIDSKSAKPFSARMLLPRDPQ